MNSLGTRRVSMQLFAVFACAALLLAAIGIYGVMAYSVTQRTQEIGIRMALGAQRSDMLQMILRQSFSVVAIGLAIGLYAALALTRLMASLLYGVSAHDFSILRARAVCPQCRCFGGELSAGSPRHEGRSDGGIAL